MCYFYKDALTEHVKKIKLDVSDDGDENLLEDIVGKKAPESVEDEDVIFLFVYFIY